MHEDSEIRDLWLYARQEAMIVEIERWNRAAQPSQAGMSGASGCEGGDDSDDGWTPESRQEYEAWSDEVDAIYAQEELERMQREVDERVTDR